MNTESDPKRTLPTSAPSLPADESASDSAPAATSASGALAKIAKVLNTEISLPKLPKRLMTDINRHERLDKQKEILHLLAHHESITRGDLKKAAQLVTETLSGMLQNEYTSVWLLSEDGEHLKALDEFVNSHHTHEAGAYFSCSDFPAWFENLGRYPVMVMRNEADLFKIRPEFFEINQNQGIQCGIETPIYAYGEGERVVGVLRSDDNREREFTDDEIDFHQQLAYLLSEAVHNNQFYKLEMQLYKKEQHVREQRRVLRDIMGLKSLNDGDTKATFDFICERIVDLYKVDGCTIWQANDLQNKLHCISSYDKKLGFLDNLSDFDIDRSKTPIYFDVILSGRCFAVEDVRKDMHLVELYEVQLQPEGTVSVMDAGVFHYKKLMGSICLDSSTKKQWDSSDKLFLTEVTELICECMLNKQNKYLSSMFRILSVAVEHVPCMMFAVDEKRVIQYANSAFEKNMGGGWVGKPLSSLRVAEKSTAQWGRLQTLVGNGKDWSGSLELLGADGGTVSLQVRAQPIYNDKTQVSEFIFFCE